MSALLTERCRETPVSDQISLTVLQIFDNSQTMALRKPGNVRGPLRLPPNVLKVWWGLCGSRKS
jgi:hypothetical protein